MAGQRTQRPGRCLHTLLVRPAELLRLLVLAARLQALLLSRMWSVSQEPVCALERAESGLVLCGVPLRRASSTRTGRVVAWCQP
jgi:hypothetical protein